MQRFTELRAHSAFSFLRAGSLPEDLIEQAAKLGYSALALGDRDGLYGAPRFHQAAKKAGMKAIIGAELTLRPPPNPLLGKEGEPAYDRGTAGTPRRCSSLRHDRLHAVP